MGENTVFCDHCGSRVEAGTSFCPYCGFRLEESGLPPQPRARRGGWFRRLIARFIGAGFVLVFLALGAAGVTLVAVYHGWQDRDLHTRERAEEHYQKGLVALQAGECELAIAEFEFAIRLAPDHAQAYDKLYKAEAQCQALPTPTSESQKSYKEILYDQAAAYFVQEQWDEAIFKLEQLRQLDESYQSESVQDMMFQVFASRALQLLNEDSLEEALRYFDRALEMRPEDASLGAQRRKAALYQTGESYWEADWQRAIATFSELYALDPQYKDTEQRLHDAYVRYGDSLAKDRQWCLARGQFAEALAIIPQQSTEQKRVNAHTHCVTTTPTPLPTPTVKPTRVISATLSAIGLPSGKLALSVYNPATAVYDLYIAHAGATHWIKIRDSASQPAFRSDGSRLAFRILGGSPGLGVVNADGSNALTLDVPATAQHPTWSPDGTRIAFAAQDEAGDWKIYVIAANNGSPEELGPGWFPAWGPDNWLAYNNCDDALDENGDGDRLCGVHFRKLDGNDVIRLTNDEEDIGLGWAPDAQHSERSQIVYMSDHDGNWEIYLLDFPWGRVVRMTNHEADDGLPTWSPDGRYVAFLSNREGTWAIYVMSRDGKTLSKVLDVAVEHPDWLHDRLSWAP
ncbi:MAG: PD40 domain-containing protein [Anaerolineae bacterium]|nr:MAG: PD40 domain-containing protein [Anaerolineae bacterium]